MLKPGGQNVLQLDNLLSAQPLIGPRYTVRPPTCSPLTLAYGCINITNKNDFCLFTGTGTGKTVSGPQFVKLHHAVNMGMNGQH